MGNRKLATIKINRDTFTAAITDRGWTIHSFILAMKERPFGFVSERSFRRYMEAGEMPISTFSEVVCFLRAYPDDVVADGELNKTIFVEREVFSENGPAGAQWTFANTECIYRWWTTPAKIVEEVECL